MAKFFIERPVLANVISILMLLLGAVAIAQLPISLYPPITPPTVQVTASYPGASAKMVMEKVALPIEQQVNGVEGMIYMQSSSTNDGNYTLTVSFAIGTDLNFAQILVQNKVSSAIAQLPQSVQQQGVVTKKKSTAILEIITLASTKEEHDSLFLNNYALTKMKDQLARLQGVGDINVFGIGKYSMRVWLNPQLMNERSLVPKDVIDAINAQSQSTPAGQVGLPPAPVGQEMQLTVNLRGSFSEASDFENIIVKTSGGSGGQITRIKDIGRVELGSQTYSQFFNLNNKQTAGIAIFQLPDANALDVAKRVKEKADQMAKFFPEGMSYSIPYDTTTFVKASINEVYRTLFEAGILVLVIIMLFLQNFRATLVPATTVPISIVGTFAAMAVMGYSINLLTLFAVVLAIGIVVDDAIIIVEGVTKHIEKGKTPKQASIDAMKELTGPVFGISLVLLCVFLPPAFMPGITGEMYRQFALVMAATTIISAINAVTLKPTQCAIWLKAEYLHQKKNIIYRGFNAIYDPIERKYSLVVQRLLNRSGTYMAVTLFIAALSIYGLTKIPTGFVPTEDQGYVIGVVQLPDAASLQRTNQVMQEISATIRKIPGVRDIISIGGVSPLDGNASLANAGLLYIMFDDWAIRPNLKEMYTRVDSEMRKVQGAEVLVLPPPPIQGMGMSAGFQMQLELVDGSGDLLKLQRAAEHLSAAINKNPMIQRVISPFSASVPQLAVAIDRDKSESMEVNIGNAYSALQTYMGSSFVNQFTKFGTTYNVFVQADSNFRNEPEDIKQFGVRSQDMQMVPLGTLADVTYDAGPGIAGLYNLYPTAVISGGAAAGISSGQALELVERLAQENLPVGVAYDWTAMSFQEKLLGNSAYFIFVLCLVLVYCVLSAQYESWILSGAVIISVPLALLGTVGALALTGLPNNIYVQIGLVLLIALSAKNAILIVEFARELRAEGVPIIEAAAQSAKSRFRPIMMTSLTMLLGVLPLVLSSGAGASARKSIGIAVFSGMFSNAVLAVFFVPCIYVVLQRFIEWREARKS